MKTVFRIIKFGYWMARSLKVGVLKLKMPFKFLLGIWVFAIVGWMSPYSIPGTCPKTMILFHGSGANYQIADKLKALDYIDATLVSFNFPDHDLAERVYTPEDLTFGTINELLPALQVLKTYVIDKGLKEVDLYGFSAGGGALINCIAILNSSLYEPELQELGIDTEQRKILLSALQKGTIILDAPLKSIEEIIDLRGSSDELEVLARNYRENNLRPIDSLNKLTGLSLHIILHFQEHDEILSNRDDALYIKRLKQANVDGTTQVVIGDDGGHAASHHILWQFYNQAKNA